MALQIASTFLATVLLSFSLRATAPPTLSGTLVNTGTALRLELHGLTGTNYTIESSRDLNSWSPLTNGPAVNGVFAAQAPIEPGVLDRFFRGRENGSATNTFPTNVVVNADTNLTVTTIATTNGGSAVLYAQDGTKFTFTVPPLNVLDSQLITVTLVTNIAGFPFESGIIGAVQIEPDGLDLWGAGKLEISIPAGADRRNITSFGARADGTEFHLVPDRVTTNAVLIPVMRLGVYGTGLAASAELPRADRLGVAAGPNVSNRQLRAASTDPTDCSPDQTAIAKSIEDELNATTDAVSKAMVVAIKAARDAERAGFEADTDTIFTEAEEIRCQMVKTQIQIHYTDAAHNCALGGVLFQKLTQLERERELLGMPADPSCLSDFSDFPFCGMLQNCLQQIDNCCLGGRKGEGKLATVIALQRQDELLGTHCVSSDAFDKALSDCSSNAWFGSLTFNATANTTTTENNPGFTRITEKGFIARFDGRIQESVEQAIAGLSLVNLQVFGKITWDDSVTIETQTPGDCGGHFERTHDERATATGTWFHVQMQLPPGATALVFAQNVNDATGFPGAPAIRSQEFFHGAGSRTAAGECDFSGVSTATNDPTAVFLPPIPFTSAKVSGTNVDGSFDFPQFHTDPDADGKYEWHFKRNTVPAGAGRPFDAGR